jgi:hypothetical protein
MAQATSLSVPVGALNEIRLILLGKTGAGKRKYTSLLIR